MNRSKYFNFIESKLSLLAYRLEVRGSLNILDQHLHSENFYMHFFNLLFGWKLQNLNAVHQNAAGVDLIDTTNRIIVQVSAIATKQKVESSLAKDLSIYKGYSFKFISITKEAKNLQTKIFSNPHNLTFSPAKDIFDIPTLLVLIGMMDIDRQQEAYDFLKKELKSEPDPEKVESNLTTIIIILSEEDLNQGTSKFKTIPYDIEAKIPYNHLEAVRSIIDDYKIHYHRLEKIYSEFDRQGKNKSLSTLDAIRMEYLALVEEGAPDKIFLKIIEKVTQRIQTSANYTPMPEEELELCVRIIVVDAFIRCKIFKNPLENNNACS